MIKVMERHKAWLGQIGLLNTFGIRPEGKMNACTLNSFRSTIVKYPISEGRQCDSGTSHVPKFTSSKTNFCLL